MTLRDHCVGLVPLVAAGTGALALYGAHEVDAEGRFAGEHVIGFTFPNWNGLDRTTATLTQGNTIIEHLQDPGTPMIEIIWRQVRHCQ